MPQKKYNILLADDDLDDCLFFKEALEELSLSFSSSLQTVNNGEQLMNLLTTKSNDLPDILFLDLNMPRKTGFDCLSEIKLNDDLKRLPVIIFSTSLDIQNINQLYEDGATCYIQKPAEFSNLKKIILKSLQLVESTNYEQPPKENFVINTG